MLTGTTRFVIVIQIIMLMMLPVASAFSNSFSPSEIYPENSKCYHKSSLAMTGHQMEHASPDMGTHVTDNCPCKMDCSDSHCKTDCSNCTHSVVALVQDFSLPQLTFKTVYNSFVPSLSADYHFRTYHPPRLFQS